MQHYYVQESFTKGKLQDVYLQVEIGQAGYLLNHPRSLRKWLFKSLYRILTLKIRSCVCGCSKELSRRDVSIEYPQRMF